MIGLPVTAFTEKIKNSQAIFIPGGFSGGDEPDGSGKFITAFFRNSLIKDAVSDLMDNRDGMMLGICNGFQALIKLGLVPYGKIVDKSRKGLAPRTGFGMSADKKPSTSSLPTADNPITVWVFTAPTAEA